MVVNLLQKDGGGEMGGGEMGGGEMGGREMGERDGGMRGGRITDIPMLNENNIHTNSITCDSGKVPNEGLGTILK